jgi:hypothetical protein
MRTIIIAFAILAQCLAFAPAALAHGSEAHPKCKRGYIVNDDHKCVKAPQ